MRERRCDVVPVVRLDLLGADADDVGDDADLGRLGDGGRRLPTPRARGAPGCRCTAGTCPATPVARSALVRNERGSFSLQPLTSAAATDDRLVTVMVDVIRPPTTTVVG